MKKLFLVFIALCGCVVTQGQITSADLQLNMVANNDPYAETDNMGVPLPFYVATVLVELEPFDYAQGDSIVNVVKLHTKLGSSAGSSNILSRVFELNGTTVFEDGSSIFLQGNRVYLSLGSFTNQGTYYSEVKAEMSDGSLGEVYEDSGP